MPLRHREHRRTEGFGVPRKRRTRAHIIADLAINHVERHVLLAGHALERYWHDYGVDLAMHTFDERGEYENGAVLLQVKATDVLRVLSNRETIAVRVERSHLEHWLFEPEPVILIAYDAANDVAFWVDIKEHFTAQDNPVTRQFGNTVTVRIPANRIFDARTVQQIADRKNRVIRNGERTIRNEAE